MDNNTCFSMEMRPLYIHVTLYVVILRPHILIHLRKTKTRTQPSDMWAYLNEHADNDFTPTYTKWTIPKDDSGDVNFCN
jgi:hypothetical protein